MKWLGNAMHYASKMGSKRQFKLTLLLNTETFCLHSGAQPPHCSLRDEAGRRGKHFLNVKRTDTSVIYLWPQPVFSEADTHVQTDLHTHTHMQLCGKNLFDPESRCWRVVTLIKRSSADYKWRAGSSLIRVNSCPNRIRRLQPSCTDL